MFSKIAVVAWMSACAAGYPAPEVFNGVFPDTTEGHYDLGKQMGTRFATGIKKRLAGNDALNKRVKPYLTTVEGQNVYDTFMGNHQKTYPMYIEELKGIAEGSGVDFHEIFAMNLIQEFSLYAPNATITADKCSDYIVHNKDNVFLSHNEDSDFSDLGYTFLANVTVGSGPNWVAYVYMGDLATGAFGYKAGMFGFTLNKVPPSEGYLNGLGRGFVSRELLSAGSFQSAMGVLKTRPMIAGHNYQMLDIKTGETADVETYGVENKILNVATGDAPHFHANTYVLITNRPQFTDWGSIAREVRASQMPPPTDASTAFNVLGDHHNASYPVYHGAPDNRNGDITGLYTLTTALFDWKKLTFTLYTNNPKEHEVVFVGSLLN